METNIKYQNPPSGSGDVTGAASSTDNAIVRFDGTGGKTIQNSSATVNDSGHVEAVRVGIGTSGTVGQKFHMVDGNFLFDGTGETSILFKRSATVGTEDNPIFALGRIADDGTGVPALRLLYSDDDTGETLLGQFSSNGNGDFNGNQIRIRNSQTPASASASGIQGNIAWDSDYIYICTATNTWKRVAITTW